MSRTTRNWLFLIPGTRLRRMDLHIYFKFLKSLWATQWSRACKKSKSSSVQSSSVCDREDTRLSHNSSRSRAFTHFSSCSQCSLTVVRGSWWRNRDRGEKKEQNGSFRRHLLNINKLVFGQYNQQIKVLSLNYYTGQQAEPYYSQKQHLFNTSWLSDA